MGRVIIGMDPHKWSATIEVIDDREQVLAQGRFGTDRDGYQTMLKLGRQYKDRIWAVEGCNGIGRHVAQRLVADGETVLDVPAKLSARVRVFATGQGRKTDPVDAHSVAVAALRTNGLRQVVVDDTTVAMRLLVDRRDGLGRARTEALSRLHHLLLELVLGGAKKFLSAPQARALLATVRPRDIVGRTRRQLAAFTGAVFDRGDFSRARFTGGRVSFENAEFTGGRVHRVRPPIRITPPRRNHTRGEPDAGRRSAVQAWKPGGFARFTEQP